MIETLFQNQIKIQDHLDSPLLNERETFIKLKKDKGRCLRSLQMTADYLLFAVKNLNLDKSMPRIVKLKEIIACRDVWMDKKFWFYVSTIVQWLDSMHSLDPAYHDKSIIFNRFSTVCFYKIRYLTYPLYEERLAYINHLEREGMSFSSLHEYALMQLQIVDKLNLNRGVTREEISAIIATKQQTAKAAGGSLSPKWSSTFHAVAIGWLKYAGMLDEKQKDLPKDAILVKKYVKWAIEAKGLAHATLEGRERELSCFLSFIQNGLSFKEIKLDTIDSYIRYRHGCGCNRRSIATIATTLRDFLGYAYNQGWCSNIAGGIRHPKVFYLETLPYAPSWDTVQELVAHYGTSDAKGKRNTAIIAMMAIYGLRSSEVVNLRLKDMDWDKNQIYLKRAKRGGLQAFPLLPETGNLIADYIRHGRKNTLGREELFLTLFAPYKKLTGSCIYYIVSQSYSKTETGVRHKGGHSLRHACASHIINNGGTLKDVSDLLGHRLLDTTRTYAKVDLVNLRKVADLKWEGVL